MLRCTVMLRSCWFESLMFWNFRNWDFTIHRNTLIDRYCKMVMYTKLQYMHLRVKRCCIHRWNDGLKWDNFTWARMFYGIIAWKRLKHIFKQAANQLVVPPNKAKSVGSKQLFLHPSLFLHPMSSSFLCFLSPRLSAAIRLDKSSDWHSEEHRSFLASEIL